MRGETIKRVRYSAMWTLMGDVPVIAEILNGGVADLEPVGSKLRYHILCNAIRAQRLGTPCPEQSKLRPKSIRRQVNSTREHCVCLSQEGIKNACPG